MDGEDKTLLSSCYPEKEKGFVKCLKYSSVTSKTCTAGITEVEWLKVTMFRKHFMQAVVSYLASQHWTAKIFLASQH